MSMSWRPLVLLVVLVILVAALILLLNQLVRSRTLAEPAVPLTETVIKDVSAELGWQNTGILLDSGETLHIQFLSGEIRDGEAVI